MTLITGKFQLTLPKRLVDAFGIRVGDEVELVAAGDVIEIRPVRGKRRAFSTEERLHYFDEATRRQESRNARREPALDDDRGWRRDDLYDRGRPR